MGKLCKIPIICGATGSGKSRLALAWAQAEKAVIVSCDSMQIFKGLDIGTAKVSPAEQTAVKHYLLDIVDCSAEYSIADYLHDYRTLTTKLHANQQPFVVAGGSLQYVLAILRADEYGSEDATCDAAYREYLLKKFDEYRAVQPDALNPLYIELQKVDPARAEKLHPNDKKRIVRALEIIHVSGKLASAGDPRKTAQSYDDRYCLFAYDFDRSVLYERINERVEKMLAAGLLAEAERVYAARARLSRTCLQAIAYKEFFPYFEGSCTLETAVEQLKLNSRHYAKRQLSIMRKLEINYLDPQWPLSDQIDYVNSFIHI